MGEVIQLDTARAKKIIGSMVSDIKSEETRPYDESYSRSLEEDCNESLYIELCNNDVYPFLEVLADCLKSNNYGDSGFKEHCITYAEALHRRIRNCGLEKQVILRLTEYEASMLDSMAFDYALYNKGKYPELIKKIQKPRSL